MARRTRRRRRRSHTSKWKKVLVPLGVLFAALAVAAAAAGTWAIDVYNSAPPLSSLQPVQKGRSSAIYAADGFYVAAAEAARALGRRAVLLTGDEALNPVPGVPPVAHAPAGAPIVTVPYAPHSEVMPRACAVVHQGGVGTTAQAMLAGRPMLVVPFSHDQPDNADRLRRKGVARVLERTRVSAEAFTHELQLLLADEPLAARAQAMAARMRQEPGAAGAADAIEALLATRGTAGRVPPMRAGGREPLPVRSAAAG